MNKMALALAKADEIVLEKEAKQSNRPSSSSTKTTVSKNPADGPLAGMLKKIFKREDK
jgi:hypothetical protein